MSTAWGTPPRRVAAVQLSKRADAIEVVIANSRSGHVSAARFIFRTPNPASVESVEALLATENERHAFSAIYFDPRFIAWEVMKWAKHGLPMVEFSGVTPPRRGEEALAAFRANGLELASTRTENGFCGLEMVCYGLSLQGVGDHGTRLAQAPGSTASTTYQSRNSCAQSNANCATADAISGGKGTNSATGTPRPAALSVSHATTDSRSSLNSCAKRTSTSSPFKAFLRWMGGCTGHPTGDSAAAEDSESPAAGPTGGQS